MAFSSNSGGGPMTDINTTPLVDRRISGRPC